MLNETVKYLNSGYDGGDFSVQANQLGLGQILMLAITVGQILGLYKNFDRTQFVAWLQESREWISNWIPGSNPGNVENVHLDISSHHRRHEGVQLLPEVQGVEEYSIPLCNKFLMKDLSNIYTAMGLSSEMEI